MKAMRSILSFFAVQRRHNVIKPKCSSFGERVLVAVSVFVVTSAVAFTGLCLPSGISTAHGEGYTTEFRLEDCQFKTRGANPYFILKPGYQLVLEGEEDGETIRNVITVLHKTKDIFLPGIGTVKTRVVEERETVDGELVEVSRNFFAICKKTNDVFYFGEKVDNYEDGKIVNHDGSWLAGVDGAKPGIIMPGTFLLGSRYFQEQAPCIALDRAKHVRMGLTVNTPAGIFHDCVKVLETTPLEPGAVSIKIYCPGVGLIVDDVIELVEFGFID